MLVGRMATVTRTRRRALRIALVAPSLRGGGLERATADLARALAARRLVPEMFTLDGLGVFADPLRRAGVAVHDVASVGRRHAWTMGPLVRALDAFRPDLVHAQSGTWYACTIAGMRRRPTPLLYTEHGRYPPEPWRRVLVDRLCAWRTGAITAVSQQTAEYLQRVLRLGTMPVVVANGIDHVAYATHAADRQAARAELGLHPGECAAIAVGRFVPVKDHATLLRATAQVLERYPRFVLLLLGTGALEPDLRAQAEALGIAARVRFLGFRPDVSRWLGAADIFVNSSTTEGLPISLLEAMASGLPTVATRVGGIPAALGDPPAGALVPVADASSLATALFQLCTSDAHRERCRRLALQASRQFSLERMADAYISLYESLLAPGPE